jgi:hypothetical protein
VRGPTAGATPIDPKYLLLIPVCVYLLSYLYLALYHQHWNVWPVVVHESGRYTLLETTFYASHFIGHIPVLLTVALLMAGSWLAMTPDGSPGMSVGQTAVAGVLLAVVLGASAVISVVHFGVEDTFSFILQRKQQPDLYVEGGSWNLHLPSTMLQFLLIPVVVWMARRFFDRPVRWSQRGIPWLAAAAIVAMCITWWANGNPLAAVAGVWRDPRYLAHAVRELATFPLTYYPLPLAALLSLEGLDRRDDPSPTGPLDKTMTAAAGLFLVGFAYQVMVSLINDVGSLAQKPDFAKGGELSIAYLLASHSFEHFLDTLFFALLTIILVAGAEVWWTRRKAEGGRRKTSLESN